MRGVMNSSLEYPIARGVKKRSSRGDTKRSSVREGSRLCVRCAAIELVGHCAKCALRGCGCGTELRVFVFFLGPLGPIIDRASTVRNIGKLGMTSPLKLLWLDRVRDEISYSVQLLLSAS